MIRKHIAAAVFFCFLLGQGHATRLEDLAAGAAPGAFVRVDFTDLTPALFTTVQGHNILGYGQNMAWDSASQTLLFISSYAYDPGKFVRYRAAADAWDNPPLPPFLAQSVLDRTYDHLTADPTRSRLYYRKASSSRVYQYDIGGGAWDSLPPNPLMTYVTCCGALEFFPEMDALVFLNGGETKVHGSLYALTSDSADWRLLCDTLGLPNIGSFAVYNPVLHNMWLGGTGTNRSWVLDARGSLESAAPAPFAFRPLSDNMTVDPAGGRFLVLDYLGTLWSYDHGAGAWDSLLPPIPDVQNVDKLKRGLSAPLTGLGVVAYLLGDTLAPEFYLYRHDAGDAVESRRAPGGAARLTVFPNPVSGEFTIRFHSLHTGAAPRCAVYDASGKRMGFFPLNGRASAAGLAPGIYFVKVTLGGRRWIRPFLHIR